MYHLWIWHKWEFGYWKSVFKGTKEQCEEYLRSEYPTVKANGRYAISQTKPPHMKHWVGNGNSPYNKL